MQVPHESSSGTVVVQVVRVVEVVVDGPVQFVVMLSMSPAHSGMYGGTHAHPASQSSTIGFHTPPLGIVPSRVKKHVPHVGASVVAVVQVVEVVVVVVVDVVPGSVVVVDVVVDVVVLVVVVNGSQ